MIYQMVRMLRPQPDLSRLLVRSEYLLIPAPDQGEVRRGLPALREVNCIASHLYVLRMHS